MPDIKWITLLTLSDEFEANLKKGFLEEAGVECFLEPIRSPYNFLSSYKINVREDQKEKALTILSQLER